jgi:SAM-dependent methyltransferase
VTIWEEQAANWIAWTRAPGHDAYWYYRHAFFDEVLPAAGRATLEVGCGEGRVTRDLVARGHRVTAVDLSPTLLRAAEESGGAEQYVLADAASLPFDDGAFDLVVSYNSLMDFEDMPGAVREIARVLVAGGRFCACVTHPLMEAGRHDEDGVVIEGSYFGRRPFEGTFERDGLSITFRGWCYPLDAYTRALEAAGFLIEALRESLPSAAAGPRTQAEHRRIPMFLMLRALKP